jgi:hypothetical protein
MKTILVLATAAFAAAAWASSPAYVYEGKWGTFGKGDGQFSTPPGRSRRAEHQRLRRRYGK